MQTAITSSPATGTPLQARSGQRPLMIVHTVSSLRFGGMEQFVVRLAAQQRLHGHRPAILALRGGPLEETARESGSPVWIPVSSNRVTRFLAGAGKVARSRPDIIHVHNPTSLHYASCAKLLCGAKLVLTDHGQCAGVARMPKNWEARLVDGWVSVSEDVGARHRTVFASSDRYAVIHNGFEPTPPQQTRDTVLRELNLPSGLTGIVVARLEPVKDHETLLRAWSLIQSHGMGVNLLIAGDGTERRRLETLVRELGLPSERIRFLGFRKDVPDLLNAVDFFVLSSLQEGLPLAVLEAMGQKLPVVATSVGGVPEVLTNRETGILCPTRSPDILADAIEELIRDANFRRRLGQAGARHVKKHFSFEQMATRYEELYRRLVGA